MLKLTISSNEEFDEVNNKFIDPIVWVLQLEHSLASLSKWESKWEKPFLSSEKTDEETVDYIRMMTISPGVPPEVYDFLTDLNINDVNTYIAAKQTATTFKERPGPAGSSEVITAEVVYYWMVALSIPFECQDWHLNRLFTLVQVCNEKNQPEKKSKMSRADLAAQRRSLNDQRRAQYNTTG